MKLPVWISAAVSAFVATLRPAGDYVNLKKIKPGVTTQTEVLSRMGKPGFIHWNDDGIGIWEYTRQPNGSSCYMISIGPDQVVRQVEQVLNEANYAKVRMGMSKDDIRRRFGIPASKQTFNNLHEEIWEWRIEGLAPLDETYFMVHFDADTGGVKKTATRVEMKG
ncbi:MAG: hypothetical protein KGP14_08810 [Betaproteobacteria bacterium]|nr:hypothetical protein [Betaproteobacteria bacterium]